MPILKTEILGSHIDINYEEHELKKLNILIERYKKRLDEFSVNERLGKISIMFLLALKLEDELEEIKILLEQKKEIKKNDENLIIINKEKIKNLLSKDQDNFGIIEEKNNIIDELNKKILVIKNDIDRSIKQNEIDRDINLKAINEIKNLENSIQSINNKIKSNLR